MQKFENVEKIINKEINFLNGSEKLIEENYEEFVDFSSKFYNAEKRVKDKNLDKGVKEAIEKELKIEFPNSYQVVKKMMATPNHKTSCRNLGKNPEESKKVIKKTLEDCKKKGKKFKGNTIRGLGNLLNVKSEEKTLDQTIQDFIKNTTKKFEISETVLVENFTRIIQNSKEKETLDNQQNSQLDNLAKAFHDRIEENQVAKDMGLVANA
jgi:predicted metal-dependent hydrolase